MNKTVWLLITLTILAASLLVQTIFARVTPNTLEVVGRLVWSG